METSEQRALAEEVLKTAYLNRCEWDYNTSEDGEYAEGGCEAGAIYEVEGPHDMRCGSYCLEHGPRVIEERCNPPHRFFLNDIPGAKGIDAARKLALSILNTFMDRALRGEFTDISEAILDEIDLWHGDEARQPLHEWLGLSTEEYKRWAEDPSTLTKILQERKP